MNSIRNNPDSEENQRMSRDNERAVFAAKMQARADDIIVVDDHNLPEPFIQPPDNPLTDAQRRSIAYELVAMDEALQKRYRRRNKKAAKLLHDLNKSGGNIQQVPKKLRHIFTNEIDPEKLA
jgi:hypothetical protein